MKSSVRILLSEVVCLSLFFTQIIGPIFVFADETGTPLVDTPTTPISQIDVSVDTGVVISPIDPAPIMDSSTGLIESASTGSESSGGTLPLVSGTGESNTLQSSGPISLTGQVDLSTPSTPVVVPETNISPSLNIPEPQKKMKNTPDNGNEILIQFREDNINLNTFAGKYQLDQIESAHNLLTTDTIENSNIAVLKMVDGNNQSTLKEVNSMKTNFNNNSTGAVETIIRELRKDPRIAHVQRNYIYKISSLPTIKKQDSSTIVHTQSFTDRASTNDADFSNLWGLDNQGQVVDGVSGEVDADIDYPEAMAFASGKLTNTVVVAIIDTGIEGNHPDISANLWDGSNCLSDTGATLGGCQHGYDFVDEDRDPTDASHVEHGTHVAGTIGAIVNNGMGVTGVSPNVSLMPLRVCDAGGCSTAAIVRAINFARLNGAKVINASLGGIQIFTSVSDFDYLSYNAIQDFPGLFVAAAANDGQNTDVYKNFPSGFGSDTVVSGEVVIDRELIITGSVTIPALQNVLAVAASDQNDELAWFSNYGTGSVHIAAPGTSIYSTVMTEGTGVSDVISYANSWQKQSNVSGEYWNTRNTTVSGEYTDLSTALWADTRAPYASGSTAYIQKDFTGLTAGTYVLGVEAWCDTPGSYYESSPDYLDILVSTGGLFQSKTTIDESSILYYGSKSFNPTYVDGHEGYAGKINLTQGYYDGNTSVRIKWKTDSFDSDNYGCAVKNITMTSLVPGYDFKQGTSMASPHVAGAAALAWNYNSGSSIADVRNAILYGADYKPSLSNIQSSSRLNLLGMLKALIKPTITSKSITFSGTNTAILNFQTDVLAMGQLSYSADSGAWTDVPVYTIKDPTTPLVGSHIGGFSSAEVVRFAISSEKAEGMLTAVAFTITGSMSSSITNIVNSTDIELWDADTNTKIQTEAQIYGNQIVFYDIMQDFPNDTTKNFKVLFTQIGDVSPYFGETFGLIPFDINVSNTEYNGGITLNNVFTTLYNTLDLTAPTTLVTLNSPLTQNSKIATLKVTNIDSTSDLTLSGVLLQFQIRSSTLPPVSFTGVVCLRDLGSTASCGTQGATQATEITQSGGIFYFDIQQSLLSNTGIALAKNGGYAEYEVYIENGPLWVEGDAVNVLAGEIQYSPYTFVSPVLPDPTLTLKNATTTAPSTSTIASVSSQEVGRFALSSAYENIRVTRLTVSAEGTFVNTLSDVVDASSVELWNADTNIQIPATVSLTGNTVIFDSMTNDISLDYTVNMKIVFTSVKPLDANYGNTLQFTLNTGDITVISMDSLRRVILDGTTTMKQYTFGVIPPTVLLTPNSPLSQNAKLATLRVTNVDSNTGIILSGVTVQFQARSTAQGGFTFSGAICLRDLGSTASCGTLGTSDAYSTDQAGGIYTMNIAASQLSNASTILTQNGGYAEYEVYLDNAPLWVAGDNANVTIKSIDYSTVNGVPQSQSFVGVSGASSTSTKSISKTKTIQSTIIKRYTGFSHSDELSMPYTYDTLDHTFTLTGLVDDTTYYYTITTCGIYLCNDDLNTLYSFHTPKSASMSISTTVTSTGTLYLSGATATGMVFTGSTGSGRIILMNTGNTVSVSIPTSGLIISASGVWDGSLEAPSVDTGSHTINLTGGSVAVYVIHHIGNNSTPLALSGQLATISIAITAVDGYSVAVYRSDAIGLPYAQIATCIVQNNTCTFTTDHFSLFALGNPVAPTPTYSSNTSSSGGPGGGGGGGGGSSYSILIPVDRSQSIPISTKNTTKTSLTTKAISAREIAKSLNKKNILSWIQGNSQALSSDTILSIFQMYVLDSGSKIQGILAYNSAITATTLTMKSSTSVAMKYKLKELKAKLQVAKKEYLDSYK